MNTSLIALVLAALVVGVILAAIIHFCPPQSSLKKEKYQSRWIEIERKFDSGSADSRHMAIVEADKLLDMALRETGSRGKTMGERMKNRQGVWSNANAIWAAHKLRNQIAHEEQVNVSEDILRRALASFKRALRDLEAL
ncbi:hypothetical protein B7Y94_02030 [Candidatus Saccharibacteria bacterium 32-49-12]|nr:MAG: hypothetical protein B7Y94_02030 [Candidatus Saccharibacteria bacterium 32-49-12]